MDATIFHAECSSREVLPACCTQLHNARRHKAADPPTRHPPPPTGELIPMSVKEGDKVLLPDYGGTTVKLQDNE